MRVRRCSGVSGLFAAVLAAVVVVAVEVAATVAPNLTALTSHGFDPSLPPPTLPRPLCTHTQVMIGSIGDITGGRAM